MRKSLFFAVVAIFLGCKTEPSIANIALANQAPVYTMTVSGGSASLISSGYGFDAGFDSTNSNQSSQGSDALGGGNGLDSINPIIERTIEEKWNDQKAECTLGVGNYVLEVRPLVFSSFYFVRFSHPIFNCPVTEGYVKKTEVKISSTDPVTSSPVPSEISPTLPVGGGAPSDSSLDPGVIVIKDATACEYSWEERPGTTDYTLFDSYLGRNYSKPDRGGATTLQGAKILRTGNTVETMCANGRLLKGCFARAMQKASSDSLSAAYLTWAKSRGVDPTRLRMAIAMQETHLGGLNDSCGSGSCNGIGMNQIITIVTDSGVSTNSPDRPEWTGITHNVLTNMKYGIRVLASKIRGSNPPDMRALARAYNGSATAAAYAEAVVRNYSELQNKCGL